MAEQWSSGSEEEEEGDEGQLAAYQSEVSSELWELPWIHSVVSSLGLTANNPLSSIFEFAQELYDCQRSILVVKIFATVLEYILDRKNINTVRRFEKALSFITQFHPQSRWYEKEDSPLNQSYFFDLGVHLKVLILKMLLELQLSGTALGESFVQSESPIGTDALGDSYWNFGGTRMYRFNHEEQDVSLAWELVCETRHTWEHQIQLLGSSTHPAELELSMALSHDVYPEVMRKFDSSEEVVIPDEERQEDDVDIFGNDSSGGEDGEVPVSGLAGDESGESSFFDSSEEEGDDGSLDELTPQGRHQSVKPKVASTAARRKNARRIAAARSTKRKLEVSASTEEGPATSRRRRQGEGGKGPPAIVIHSGDSGEGMGVGSKRPSSLGEVKRTPRRKKKLSSSRNTSRANSPAKKTSLRHSSVLRREKFAALIEAREKKNSANHQRASSRDLAPVDMVTAEIIAELGESEKAISRLRQELEAIETLKLEAILSLRSSMNTPPPSRPPSKPLAPTQFNLSLGQSIPPQTSKRRANFGFDHLTAGSPAFDDNLIGDRFVTIEGVPLSEFTSLGEFDSKFDSSYFGD